MFLCQDKTTTTERVKRERVPVYINEIMHQVKTLRCIQTPAKALSLTPVNVFRAPSQLPLLLLLLLHTRPRLCLDTSSQQRVHRTHYTKTVGSCGPLAI